MAARASVVALRAKFDQFLPHLGERRRRIYLAREAVALGHGGITLVAAASGVSASTIARGIAELPDRDAQFTQINATAAAFLEDNQPVISVDTKAKEWLGNRDRPGRIWRPGKNPIRVDCHTLIGSDQPPWSSLTGSTTLPATPAGSMSGPITSRASSRLNPSAAGGGSADGTAIRTPAD